MKKPMFIAHWLFWIVLVAFIAWDHLDFSAPVNLRMEAPIITAGSGTPSHAGHCAILK